jgi:eukaryotic-like serine/threonine-protein kinase
MRVARVVPLGVPWRKMRDGERDAHDGTLPGVGEPAPVAAAGEAPKPIVASRAALLDTLPAAATAASKAQLDTLPAATANQVRLDTLPAATANKAQLDTLPAATANMAQLEALPAAAHKAQLDTVREPTAADAAARRNAAVRGDTLPADYNPTAAAAARQRLATDPTLQSDSTSGANAAVPIDPTLPGPHTVADLPALQRIDDSAYAIGHEIARGGMGKILLARDRRLRRDVVIKVTQRDSGRIDPRFEREALITARLQHPSIVRVYDAGVLGDGRAFYAMERVRGRSLEVVIEEAKTLRQRLALLPHAIAVADAIAYAHSEGVLHRDLKPGNVLIGPFGETVVIDWGLAKDVSRGESSVDTARDPTDRGSARETRRDTERAANGRDGSARDPETDPDGDPDTDRDDGALTQLGAVLGTPSYMAPEQARGEVSDERSDIYALGALLYTLLTGAPPYRGRSTDEVLELVAAGARRPIGEREPALPPELATIVEHAMAYQPSQRFASAKDLADELRRFAAGKLVASHAYSIRQLLRRWVRRHRIVVAVAGAALALVALVGVLGVRGMLRERDIATTERLKAEAAEDRANTRYDSLLYGLARKDLGIDPSRTAAWLKLMSDRALAWDQTHELAAEAARRGLAHELRGHTQDVEHVEVTPDGKRVITGSDDATARVWDLAAGTSVVLAGHRGPIETMILSRDGALLATAGTDGDVWLWELATGTGKRLQGHRNTVRGLAFSPDGARLASAGEDGVLFVWNVATGTGRALVEHTAGLRPVAWFDDATLLAGGLDGKLGRFHATTGKGTMVRVHDAELRSIALSADRAHMMLGDDNGLVTLWSGADKPLRTLARHVDVAREVMFTPDGRHGVSAGGDPIVRVYSIPDGRVTELAGHHSGIKDVALDASGELVAAAGIDNTVRVWKLDGTPLRVFLGSNAAVKAVAFTPDRRLVSGAESDIARVWRLDELEAPPSGPALREWLARHTNLEEQTPR